MSPEIPEFGPEYSVSVEIADQDDLRYLFEQTTAQIKSYGSGNELPPAVPRSVDGIPILSDYDKEHEQMGTKTISLAASLVNAAISSSQLGISRNVDKDVKLTHTPAHYRQDTDSVGTFSFVPEEVVFTIPRDEHSGYLEDSIHLQRVTKGDMTKINVQHQHKAAGDVDAVDGQEQPSSILFKVEVAQLIVIARTAGLGPTS